MESERGSTLYGRDPSGRLEKFSWTRVQLAVSSGWDLNWTKVQLGVSSGLAFAWWRTIKPGALAYLLTKVLWMSEMQVCSPVGPESRKEGTPIAKPPSPPRTTRLEENLRPSQDATGMGPKGRE